MVIDSDSNFMKFLGNPAGANWPAELKTSGILRYSGFLCLPRVNSGGFVRVFWPARRNLVYPGTWPEEKRTTESHDCI